MNHYNDIPPVSETLVDAIKSQLETITVTNGYWNTVGEVYTSLAQRATTPRWPAIEVVTGREDTENEDMGDQALHKVLNIRLLCYQLPNAPTQDQARTFQQRMKADIEYLFGNNPSLKDSNGDSRCFNSIVAGAAPFPRLDGQNYNGIMVDVRVWYRQDLKDPSVQV